MAIKNDYTTGQQLAANDFNGAAAKLNNLPDKIVYLTQVEYDNLVALNIVEPNTVYLIPLTP